MTGIKLSAASRVVAAMLVAALALGASAGVSLAKYKDKHQSPLQTILDTKLHADPAAAPDFVEKSRVPGGTGYIPLHAKEPERKAKPKTADELKAMEAELDKAGAANRRRAGLPVAPAAKKSATISKVSSSAPESVH